MAVPSTLGPMRLLLAGRVAPDALRGEGRYLQRLSELVDGEVALETPSGGGLRAKVGLELAVRRRVASFRPDRIVAFAPEVPSGLAPTTGVLAPLARRENAGGGLGRLRGRLRAVRDAGRDARIAPSAIAVARHGTSAEVFHPGPGPEFFAVRAVSPGEGTVRVLQIGAVRAGKGTHLAVEAVRGLARERERAELHLLGPVPEPEYLRRLERRVDGVTVVRHERPLDAANRAALVASAHIVTAPSTEDGTWGFALLEAMAVGVPVVGSNLGDHRELLGDAGVEVQAGDVKRLGMAIRKLLRDREHWEDRAAAVRASAEDRFGDESAIRARLARLLS